MHIDPNAESFRIASEDDDDNDDADISIDDATPATTSDDWGRASDWNWQPDADADVTIDYIGASANEILRGFLLNVDVTEIYSPPRVAEVCKQFNMTPGSSMDLATGFDFDKGEDRRRAATRILTEKPNLLIGSPECTLFSMLQQLNLAIRQNDPGWKRLSTYALRKPRDT